MCRANTTILVGADVPSYALYDSVTFTVEKVLTIPKAGRRRSSAEAGGSYLRQDR